ncbi:hypothetical protein BO71DRAFT_198303 [Aspergillus ellipticus CBS 707.79]|uniref:Uncharacterized protein n=1 Tax=Aspergillus ellipticus CBS 707.79 TaxID=1448320 RepID=A0A319DEI9_9EURO|nr:hypothetical protein BO71DRAFT_198303 [Aspergillus ellipticus CBS 707.79]
MVHPGNSAAGARPNQPTIPEGIHPILAQTGHPDPDWRTPSWKKRPVDPQLTRPAPALEIDPSRTLHPAVVRKIQASDIQTPRPAVTRKIEASNIQTLHSREPEAAKRAEITHQAPSGTPRRAKPRIIHPVPASTTRPTAAQTIDAAAWNHPAAAGPQNPEYNRAVDLIVASWWDQALTAMEQGPEAAKEFLKRSPGPFQGEPMPAAEETLPKKAKGAKAKRAEPARNPDCVDPEKDFYDVCWEIIKEMNLVDEYLKDKEEVSSWKGLCEIRVLTW